MFFADLAIWIWGGFGHLVPKPASFEGGIQVGELSFPSYRFLVIIVGVIVAVFLWWFHEKSAYGAIVRAGEDNEEMTQGIGVNIHLVRTLVFGLGAMLAGLGGVIGAPILGVYPGQDFGNPNPIHGRGSHWREGELARSLFRGSHCRTGGQLGKDPVSRTQLVLDIRSHGYSFCPMKPKWIFGRK